MTTISSGTSCPFSINCLARFPFSVPEATSALRRSPAAMCTKSYCKVKNALVKRVSRCVMFKIIATDRDKTNVKQTLCDQKETNGHIFFERKKKHVDQQLLLSVLSTHYSLPASFGNPLWHFPVQILLSLLVLHLIIIPTFRKCR